VTDPAHLPTARTTAAYGTEPTETLPSSGSQATSTLAARGGSPTPLLDDRERYLARVEHHETVARMRRLVPAAAVGWAAFFVLDAMVVQWVFPTTLEPFAWLRGLGLLVLLLAAIVLASVKTPSRALVRALDVAMILTTAGCLAAMGVLAGGIASPYHVFVVLVMLGRAAVVPHRWQDAAWRLALPLVVDVAVVAFSSALSPSLRETWIDETARGHYLFNVGMLACAWTLAVLGSHNAWALRRQVFASRNLGRFKLRRRIGHGGMGEVWVARDEDMRRDVALKVLRPTPSDPEASIRFEREIRATAALSHPNTIRIFNHGVTDDGLVYYAMELLEGETLQALVHRLGPLPPDRAASLVRQAARALSEAHEGGIVHRDVKPENLFITSPGGEADVVKVLDFGIARLSDDDAGLTQAGFVTGTPAYMAPEVATGGDATASSDVYGLGATLYFALTGAPIFDGPDVASVMRRHIHDPVPAPSTRMHTPLDAQLEQTVMCALRKDPTQRFASAADFAAALPPRVTV